jgi:hypothetical protein
MIAHDSKARPKADSGRKTKKESACRAFNRRRVGSFGKDLRTEATTNLTLNSGGNCRCNRTLFEIIHRWKAGLKAVRATSKPWPALPKQEEAMVDQIVPYIYLFRDKLARFIARKKEGEPWE